VILLAAARGYSAAICSCKERSKRDVRRGWGGSRTGGAVAGHCRVGAAVLRPRPARDQALYKSPAMRCSPGRPVELPAPEWLLAWTSSLGQHPQPAGQLPFELTPAQAGLTVDGDDLTISRSSPVSGVEFTDCLLMALPYRLRPGAGARGRATRWLRCSWRYLRLRKGRGGVNPLVIAALRAG
jgi:hypothetical protein